MADPKPHHYADFLPGIYRQPDANGSAAFLDTYLTIFQQILGRRFDPEDPDPANTVVRKGMASVIDILPGLFYPRLSFLFPDDTDDFIPPLQTTTTQGVTDDTDAMNTLNDYFGLANPTSGQDFQSVVDQAVTQWLGDFLTWQSSWVGLASDNNWSLDQQRENLATILPIFRARGTAAGLQDLLTLFVGGDIAVIDAVAAPPMTVGYSTLLKSAYEAGDSVIGGVRPYAFVVQLTVSADEVNTPQTQQTVAAIRAFVDVERPVHTNYTVTIKVRPADPAPAVQSA